jgi:hypothetical protein
MFDLSERLMTLGYKPHFPSDPGDFVCYDPGDGTGQRIVEWLSSDPQPTQELLQETVVRLVPQQVTRGQALLALDTGGLYDVVKSTVDAHPVRAVQIWYYNALTWARGNVYIQALAAELSLTDEQVDNLFIQASLYQ